MDEFFHNVVDLLAHEEIAQERLNGIGTIEASELVRDNYLILRHGDERGASIDEYRMDEKGNRMDQVGLDKGFLVTAGFAFSCNYFLYSLSAGIDVPLSRRPKDRPARYIRCGVRSEARGGHPFCHHDRTRRRENAYVDPGSRVGG